MAAPLDSGKGRRAVPSSRGTLALFSRRKGGRHWTGRVFSSMPDCGRSVACHPTRGRRDPTSELKARLFEGCKTQILLVLCGLCGLCGFIKTFLLPPKFHDGPFLFGPRFTRLPVHRNTGTMRSDRGQVKVIRHVAADSVLQPVVWPEGHGSPHEAHVAAGVAELQCDGGRQLFLGGHDPGRHEGVVA